MIQVSEEFLASVLGTTAGEITDALKDGENDKPQDEIESFLKEKFEGRIFKAKNDGKKEGHGRGLKESLTNKEKELKAKLGVEGDTIDEIIDAALEAATKKAALNPDDVKNSDIYINEVKRLKTLIAEKETELANKDQSFTKAETMRLAKELGLKYLNEKKFVLSDDEDIKDEALANLFGKLEDDHTKLSVIDGKVVVVDSNGKPKENEQGTKEISFEDHFVSKAKRYFKQAVADDRKSPANKNDGKTGNVTPEMPELNTAEDLYKALEGEKDVIKQKAIKAHYDEKVKDGTIK